MPARDIKFLIFGNRGGTCRSRRTRCRRPRRRATGLSKRIRHQMLMYCPRHQTFLRESPRDATGMDLLVPTDALQTILAPDDQGLEDQQSSLVLHFPWTLYASSFRRTCWCPRTRCKRFCNRATRASKTQSASSAWAPRSTRVRNAFALFSLEEIVIRSAR